MISKMSEGQNCFLGKFDERPRVVIMYEDSVMGLRAKHSLERIGRRMNLQKDPFDVRWWSFDFLAEEDRRKLAAREASNFDIIIFSVRNCNDLPACIKEWLHEWLRHREQRPCALCVLVDELARHVEKMMLVNYLNTVAGVGGIDLVPPFREASKSSFDLNLLESAVEQNNLTPPWHENSHWWSWCTCSGIKN